MKAWLQRTKIPEKENLFAAWGLVSVSKKLTENSSLPPELFVDPGNR
jgi:hypothetical protein